MLDEHEHKLQETVGEEKTDKNKEEAKGKKEKPATPSEALPDKAEISPDAEAALEEIDESNAEDAEDADNDRRHHIPMSDYQAMSLENLVGELQRLVRNEKIQAIKRHVDSIKKEFDLKFREFLSQKKEEYLEKGGNPQDFKYNSVTKRQFNEVFSEYREKRNAYYKNLENSLHDNLSIRLAIIEELKGLVSMEEDINTTYKNFKSLQERWRNAGPVPRNKYNDVWRTYHHHVEIFYDFLHLNRELRDLDFKHNLEEKTKLIERAEKLLEEPDVNKAFRELQTLHKIWKEEVGPVAKEDREKIWERFSAATKAMHQKRQDFYKHLEKDYEKNLEVKREIIGKIRSIAEEIAPNHRGLQQQIRSIEKLREDFFKAGKVPQKDSDKTWNDFKEAVRNFNRTKNAFYKGLKKQQLINLDQKKALVAKAQSLKDSEDWDKVTPEMKRIQREWKEIGHVPRKYSESIWNEFKAACNHYFNRLHADKNKSQAKESVNFNLKNAILERLKSYKLSGDKDTDLKAITAITQEWNSVGRVPFSKKNINGKFHKTVEALLRKAGISRQESEMLKYGSKIQALESTVDDRAIYNERTFLKRKIKETKAELRQLENNLAFFNSASEDNPLLKEAKAKIERHKEEISTLKTKVKQLNILEHNRSKEESTKSAEEE